ncbi:pleiotropic drug resistance protein [Trifolium repens]|nr:pleiotropic drug resistance protein [Trifolium repens]
MATNYHVRSNSFPSGSHPSSTRIEQDLNKIKTWEATSTSTSDSITIGLTYLEDLYISLEDLLNTTSTQKAISHNQGEKFVEELLDGSVKILDICGITRDTMLQIKENVQSLHSSLRRRKGDSSIETSVAEYNLFTNKMKKNVTKLIKSLKQMESKFRASSLLNQDQEFVSVIRVLRDVIVMNISIFQSILSFLVGSASKSKANKWFNVAKLMHKKTISCEEKLENFNELQCVEASLRTLSSEVSDVAKMQTTHEKFEGLENAIEMIENAFGSSKSIIVEEEGNRKNTTTSPEKTSEEMTEPAANIESFEGADMEVRNKTHSSIPKAAKNAKFKKGMVLPFQPLSLVFENVNYYIDMPNEMKQGTKEDRLQLLRDISGAFRPRILIALVGVSGAGKTTLMDVLSGRKTSGCIEGGMSISGYPKNQATFARISGYCEQNDIHSPNITVYESLLFSAWLRLSKDVDIETRKMFIEEVIELVELHLVKNFLVGLPGIDGLSTEQRKRLTIAVELVANPSIIFMDEPTGRTVVCTIHQPSIDIFENFDELLLMKTSGQVIYGGPLGRNSEKLIEYFEAITGIPKIEDGYNPATWMLDISSPVVESQLKIDFAELYNKSSLYQRNQELIKELSIPAPGTKELYFPSKYSQTPQYNGVKYFVTIVIGVLFGLIYWKKGDKLEKEQDLLNLIGAMYPSVIFLGASNTSSVQPIVAIERTVLYRERAAGLYSELPYAIGQVAIEVIYVALQSLIYSIILYWMIGFEPQVENFFWFYFFICHVLYLLP